MSGVDDVLGEMSARESVADMVKTGKAAWICYEDKEGKFRSTFFNCSLRLMGAVHVLAHDEMKDFLEDVEDDD